MDHGPAEISLGGSRLKRFMENIEKVTQSIPSPTECRAPNGSTQSSTQNGIIDGEKAGGGAVWEEMLTTGISFLEKLAKALAPGTTNTPNTTHGGAPSLSAASRARVERDPKTGEAHLRIPLPKPEVLEKLTEIARTLVQSIRI